VGWCRSSRGPARALGLVMRVYFAPTCRLYVCFTMTEMTGRTTALTIRPKKRPKCRAFGLENPAYIPRPVQPTSCETMKQEGVRSMKLGMAFMAILLTVGLASAVPLDSSASTSDLWHVAGTPTVISQEVRFTNAGADLVGTVYLPSTGNHLPAVVVLHHAGAATREAALYRHLREGLPALGFAVLIYDRRGSGQSSGSLQGVDYETLADDAVAGQHALAKLSRIDPAKIGFWGLSQGGWLAVLAAGRSRNGAFAISVSAPLVTADEQMQFATSNLLAIRGYSQEVVREMLETRRAWTGYLRGTNSRAAAADALAKAQSQPWFDLTYMPRVSELTNDPAIRRKMDDDPVAAVLKAKVPLLFLYGGSDPWVPVARSVERLNALSSQRHNIESGVIANTNHELMFPAQETMQVDADTNRNDAPQSQAYFMLLGSWLSRQFPNRKRIHGTSSSATAADRNVRPTLRG